VVSGIVPVLAPVVSPGPMSVGGTSFTFLVQAAKATQTVAAITSRVVLFMNSPFF
jgi:hypothetical protein